jgi:hypothetical protein
MRGHERRKSGEKTRSCSSEEDRWQRSRDLANLEVRRVRAQTLGTPSHKDARSEKEDIHWIWVAGGPLDQSPIAFRCFGGAEVERISSQHQKSRSRELRHGVLRSSGSRHLVSVVWATERFSGGQVA